MYVFKYVLLRMISELYVNISVLKYKEKVYIIRKYY